MPGFLRRVAGRLPRVLVEAARAARTAAYRAAGPFDAWNLRRQGRGPLPPLWLRRHAGEVRDFESPNPGWLALLDAHGALDRADARLLDIGCGPGSLALALRPRLAPGARYTGFDVHAPSLAWCARHFAGDPRYAFELARLESPYGGRGGASIASYRFPVEDGEATAVLARSVFTHLLEEESAHYLRETRRVLAPEGLAFFSAFLFEGSGRREEVPAFPYPSGPSRVRWRVEARPHAGVAYAKEAFLGLAAASGLALVEMRPGFYPGSDAVFTGQDLLVLARAR